jgi:hypothetical protein
MAGLAGGAALLGAGVLTRNPGLLAKAGRGAMNLRSQLMLTGLAIPKAIVSNVGGAAIQSAERGTLAPIKELLSRETVRDFRSAFSNPAIQHEQAAMAPKFSPGRVLGAIDEATQKAMGRAGMSADDAERMTFQTPLNKRFGSFGETLDSPAARYLIPFRRTPFNATYEGFKALKEAPQNPKTTAAMLGLGAAHGAATSDEQYPVSMGLGAAAANKYAVPYLIAAAAGRAVSGGRDPGSVAGEALPISEYGLTSGVTDPTKAFTDPAGYRLVKRLLGMN